MSPSRRHLPLEGAHNVRDLGGFPTQDGGRTAWRQFLRADSLHRLSENEVAHLHDAGLRTVIDLRTRQEVQRAPNPFAAFADVHYLNLPLFDDLSPAALSRPRDGADHPLFHFYLDAIETRGAALCQILAEMAAAADGAVLFNCTAGKDRTGIIAALLLWLAGVPKAEIVADYAATEGFIPDLKRELLDLARHNGTDVVRYARLLESPAPTMEATLDQLAHRHGGVEGYLDHIGLPAADRARLRDRLRPPEPHTDEWLNAHHG